MKKLLLAFSLMISGASISYGQTWDWGRQGTCNDSSGGAEGYGVTVDKNGNAICSFINDIGTITFSPYSVSSKFGGFCIAKYTPSGNVVWLNQSNFISHTSGASPGSGAQFMTTDPSGNIYITGYFIDTVIFGSTKLIGKGAQNCFVAKYDPNGNIKWAKQSVEPSKACLGWSNSIATNKVSNEYISGAFNDTCSFDNFTLKSNGISEMFLEKCDSAGNVIWITQSTGINKYGTGTQGMGLDANGNVYVACQFSTVAYFGATKLTSVLEDNCVVKYDTAGNVIWVRQSHLKNVNGLTGPSGIAVDANGNSYLSGFFTDTILFGSTTLTSDASGSSGSMFLIKYDSAGNLKWAKQSGALPGATTGMSLDTMGHLYFTMYGLIPGDFFTIGNDTLFADTTQIGNDEGSFIIELDTAGVYLCSSYIPAGGDDLNGMATDPRGEYVYFSGDLANIVNFGKDTIGTMYPFSEFPFVARWEQCGIIGSVKQISSNNFASVYPNPSKGIFNFQLQGITEKVNIEAYNILGKKVYSNSFSNSQFSVDLSSNPSGIYLYRIISEKGEPFASGKLIIQ